MPINEFLGYMGKILRVDLSSGSLTEEPLTTELVEKYVGGTGFGAEYLYREVSPGIAWDHPDNRIIIASGPFAGTSVPGSGTYSLVTKGPMTNLAVSTQANGFFGAYLKLAGYDALIIQGQSSRWVYLHIGEGKVELRDATSLVGKNMLEVEEIRLVYA